MKGNEIALAGLIEGRTSEEWARLAASGAVTARRSLCRVSRRVIFSITALVFLLSRAIAQAQPYNDPTNLFGSRGLMGTPSARMAPDGELSVGASFLENNQHYNLEFQVLPWLDTTLRYSGLQDFYPGYPVYYDRAFGLKPDFGTKAISFRRSRWVSTILSVREFTAESTW